MQKEKGARKTDKKFIFFCVKKMVNLAYVAMTTCLLLSFTREKNVNFLLCFFTPFTNGKIIYILPHKIYHYYVQQMKRKYEINHPFLLWKKSKFA